MITREQYRMLNSILKSNGTTAKDYPLNREMYDFLFSQQYIKKYDVRGYRGYIVTELGKIEMKAYREDIYRFRITTILSVIAIITSIFSIAIQTEPVRQLLEQLLKQ